MMTKCATAFVVLVSMATVVEADVVQRRGGEPALSGRIERIDEAGVKIITEAGVEHLVSWDRVRTIESDSKSSMAKYADLATQSWRARSRLERGDAAMAEPLFDRLFAQTRGQTHETALVIAEGLLRCRLARGENVGAVIPWLETARLRKGLGPSTVYSLLPVVIDEKTWLCPFLAPLWMRSHGLETLSKELGEYRTDDDLINWFAAAYQHAARIHVEARAPTSGMSKAPDHPGAQIVQSILSVATADAAGDESARASLRKQLDGLPSWGRAWAFVALGVSVRSDDPLAVRQQAMVDLVHVPAEFQDDQPYLAAMALWKLAEGCSGLGDAAAASVFVSEFKSHFPQLAVTVGLPLMSPPPAVSSRPTESTP